MNEDKENSTKSIDLYGKIEKLMGIDLRSLGIFRVGLGAILLIDLCIRATALGAHYTDAGVAPRSLVVAYGEQPWFMSFHMLSGGLMLQIVLFILAGTCAFALLIGYRSRIFCFGCWILTLSMHVRNPFVNNLGDWLLVDLLFWGMFLPLGAKFSLDVALRSASWTVPKRTLSIASLAILLQVGLMYFFSVQHKITPAWRVDGTAVAFALNLDRIVTGVGKYLLSLPEGWLKFMTFATVQLERWGPIVAFVPFFTGPIRTGVAGVFMAFHLALALFFELGIFPYVCMIAWTLYLPSWFWDQVYSRAEGIRSMLARTSAVSSGLIGRVLRGRTKPLVSMPGKWETGIATLALLGMFSSGLLYNGFMGVGYYEAFYKHMEPIVNTLNMKQRWDMFSPQPPKNDGWFVVVAYTSDGEAKNVLHPEEAVVWDRPAEIAETYINQRWRKYLEWVMSRKGPFAEAYSRYCEALYRSQYPESENLKEVGVYLMEEYTLGDLTTSAVIRNKLN